MSKYYNGSIQMLKLSFVVALSLTSLAYAQDGEGDGNDTPPLNSEIWIGGAKVTVDESMIPQATPTQEQSNDGESEGQGD